MAEAGEPLNMEKFINHVQADYVPHTVVIDCTASAAVADQYRDWLARGIHIVTPNKKANSGTLPYYRSLQDAKRRRRHALFVRGDGGRRVAGHTNVARPARNRR